MKKVISVVGARPNFMKVAPIDRAFKKYSDIIEHIIVHTGQHYDHKMSAAFFQDLNMPEPKYFLNVGSGSHSVQTAKVMVEFEKVCLEVKPDLVLVVGDVNSTIAATLTAVKLGIKVAHIEGGLRSRDRSMPEEINRIATDAICNYCFTTEPVAMENLINENYPKDNIYYVGNTMIDSQVYALPMTKNSNVLLSNDLKPKEFVLVTIHRPSNVDEPEQLKMLLDVFNYLSKSRKVIFPIHPRTLKNISAFGLNHIIENNKNILFLEPLGYIDFLSLMKDADFIMTDSGGIQEETTALKIHCLTIRTSTERPITTEIGTNILVYPNFDNITNAIDNMLTITRKKGSVPEMWDGKTGERITSIIVKDILFVE
jgi:UDP-N-acetylglucosamine 2-epimerase (non-hydrolysing)